MAQEGGTRCGMFWKFLNENEGKYEKEEYDTITEEG